MVGWITLPAIVIAALVLGTLIASHFISKETAFDGDGLAWLFVVLCLGVVALGWLALLLAQTGFFSLATLTAAWLLLMLGLAYSHWRRGREFWRLPPLNDVPAESRPWPWPLPAWHLSARSEWLLLGAWLLAAVWLFFRPHEFIVGGADAGVYINLSASIAKTGSILIRDGTLAGLDPALYPALLRSLPSPEAAPYYLLPGFYVTGEIPGLITPQFYPLHPVWQAVAYTVSGVRGALLISGLWALLGCLALYLVARQAAGREVALLVLAALSLSAMQVWFARYPTTETLSQFLLWTGVWSLGAWLSGRRPPELWGFLTALTWGQLFLVRIDTYFLLAVPVFIAACLWWSGRSPKGHAWLFVPLALLTAYSFAHALWQSAPYFFNIFGYGLGLLGRSWLLPVASLVAAVAGLAVASQVPYRPQLWQALRRPLLVSAMVLLVALAFYSWFVRPYSGGVAPAWADWYGGRTVSHYDHENLLRLAWYMSPVGVWLAVIGACLMVWQVNRRTAVVLLVGIGFSLLYLWRIQANPHQIYAMRRYVPAVMPFFILAAAYGSGWFYRQQHNALRWLGLLIACAWLVGLGWSARGFISQVDYRGLIQEVDALNSRLAPASVLIFNDGAPIGEGDFIGTPLYFMYGHTVFKLHDAGALDDERLVRAIRQWQHDGRTVYWIGEGSWLESHNLSYTVESYKVSSQALEGSYTRKPTAVLPLEWQLSIATIAPE
jgi:hypothetical protein